MRIADYHLTLVLEIQGERVELAMPREGPMSPLVNRFCVENRGWDHELVMTSLLARIVETIEQPQMLDIGGFVGYYTVLGSKLLGSRGRVWAIESNVNNVQFMRQVVALNHLENADVIHTTLSDRGETLRSHYQEVSSELSGDGVIVQAETCDAMCQRLGLRPNVAKLDVHGFEGKVLGGMRGVMKNMLEYLLIELHPGVWLHKYTPEISRIDVIDFLEEAGFKTYHVAGLSAKEAHAGSMIEDGRYAYYLMNHENRNHLLFDRHNKVLIVAAKRPLEDIIGPSMIDPGLRAATPTVREPVSVA
jgi:FkbM family methyltransferase